MISIARIGLTGLSVNSILQYMIYHKALGNTEDERKKNLARLIRKGKIGRAGYRKAKIYGLLRCKSGMRMKVENRVFFKNEQEAIQQGYRPCAHCLPEEYKLWKQRLKPRRQQSAMLYKT